MHNIFTEAYLLLGELG